MLLLTILVYSAVKWCWGRVDNPSGPISYWGHRNVRNLGGFHAIWSVGYVEKKSALCIRANISIWPMWGGIPTTFNPRPAGVWLVTRPAGGGAQRAPPEISQTTGPISKFQTLFDSPVRELPVQGQIFDPEVTDDVTGQVKVRIFDFSGLVTSASKISMLSANKANESACIVSLTSVTIISCALWP